MERKKRLRFGKAVSKRIIRFPGLIFDGRAVNCIYCNATLSCWNSNQCDRHIESVKHRVKVSKDIPKWKFLYDFVYMMNVCSIPHKIVDNRHFRLFWEKYAPHWKLRSVKQLHNELPRIKRMLEINMKCELKDQKVWLTIGQTKDAKSIIGNVLVRILQPGGLSSPYLICSRRLKKFDAEAVAQLIHENVRKYGIKRENFLMLVTDGSTVMLEAGTFLKEHFPNLLHITCFIHILHLVAKTVQDNYPGVNELITQAKVSFLGKNAVRDLHKMYPEIPPPPLASVAKSATWLEAAGYYDKYFQQLKMFVGNTKSKGFKDCQKHFMNVEIEMDLKSVAENFLFIVEAINQLENLSLSLAESLDIVDNIRTVLDNVSQEPALQASMTFRTTLNQNPDFDKLWCISKCKSEPDDPEFFFKQYFQYANITSSDIEHIFSKYTLEFASLHRRFTENTTEGFLMMQLYSKCHSIAEDE